MNREQLRDIKLSGEQIKRLMALYGQSINQQSNKIKELEADNEMLSNKINNIDNQSSNDDKRVLELESERDYLILELERHKDLINEGELDKAILKNVLVICMIQTIYLKYWIKTASKLIEKQAKSLILMKYWEK